MDISYDEQKRQITLRDRGLDFADAPKVFAARHLQFSDDRMDYGEPRWIDFGELNGRSVSIVWTPRGNTRRIISMRHDFDETCA